MYRYFIYRAEKADPAPVDYADFLGFYWINDSDIWMSERDIKSHPLRPSFIYRVQKSVSLRPPWRIWYCDCEDMMLQFSTNPIKPVRMKSEDIIPYRDKLMAKAYENRRGNRGNDDAWCAIIAALEYPAKPTTRSVARTLSGREVVVN